jgi:hypothetical protein
MRDWEQFIKEIPWFVDPDETVVVGEERSWTRGGIEALPRLSALLAGARITPVTVSGKDYELIGWGPATERRGWLCDPPEVDSTAKVHSSHRLFWSVCGGIVERFGEPESWLLNQEQVLTAEAARLQVSDLLETYRWVWTDVGLDLPIEPDDYYVAAVEANGNLTLVHRRTGELLLFAPDHSFTGVTIRPGCPPFSLLTIDDAPDLGSWIELCASQW